MAGNTEIWNMKIALVAATQQEILPALEHLRDHPGEVVTLITGVGMMAAAYRLTHSFREDPPALAIQAGIAGSFDPRYAPGMVVSVVEDMPGDLGVVESGTWKDLFDMGLEQDDAAPWQQRMLKNPLAVNTVMKELISLAGVRAITVNQVSWDGEAIRRLKEKYHPDIETMEGAAFHYVCRMENIPFIQIRAISNMVGERDRSKWKTGEAISRLNQQLIALINTLTPTQR
jgi:futalosine hydrolase